MRRMSTDTRYNYLAFALKVRKLTDSLISIAEGGVKTPQLDDSVREVLAAIENSGKHLSIKTLRATPAFGRYENVQTINEVLRASDKDGIIRKLQGVLEEQDSAERRRSALDAIGFFDSLERRALNRFRHPPSLPRQAAV
jgi:hypothetical protein